MKNILIGFLMSACLFLLIGVSDNKTSILETPPEELIRQLWNEGKSSQYQITGTDNQLYMLNSKTGVLYEWSKSKGHWKRIGNKKNWIKDK
tara:strand:+ start:983 stop:1255 length:273 start_codon:yes stop_codon:yes gene_type:complete